MSEKKIKRNKNVCFHQHAAEKRKQAVKFSTGISDKECS